MSGPRPTHLGRRGAIYFVRFRIPVRLVARLGMVEFRRTLHTSDAQVARSRALRARVWFEANMQRLAAVPSLTRRDLEEAAQQFFTELASELDQPRDFDPDRVDEEVDLNIDASRRRSAELLDQLRGNNFDGNVRTAAEEIARRAGIEFTTLTERQQLSTLQLAARAQKVQMELFIHLLSDPSRAFEPPDKLFVIPAGEERMPQSPAAHVENEGPALEDVVGSFIRRKIARGLSQSQIDENTRALGWLKERFGAKRAVSSISKRELATFRDDIARLDVTLRGRGAAFQDRLTNNPSDQIKSVTALRYWRTVQALFAWAAAEGFAQDDPSSGLVMELRKGEKKRTPPPFSEVELRRFCKTPLYAGYKSPKHLLEPGACHRRGGRWWAGVLMMFTGLRAGELSQLLPSDFVFTGDIAYLRVREEDENGKKVKSAKTQSSVRDVPLSPILLELGLAQFVASRAKANPKERVFREFRLGTRGRLSDGMTKFWSNYLRKFGLWKEGRSTHVWRHTVIAHLRANGVAEEDIAALVGHSRGTQTAGYGGAYPLHRKRKTIEKLDYGFDVTSALGGPYDPKVHA